MYTELSGATAKSTVAWNNVWLCAGLLFAISVLIRLIDLNHLPRNDELYTGSGCAGMADRRRAPDRRWHL